MCHLLPVSKKGSHACSCDSISGTESTSDNMVWIIYLYIYIGILLLGKRAGSLKKERLPKKTLGRRSDGEVNGSPTKKVAAQPMASHRHP